MEETLHMKQFTG